MNRNQNNTGVPSFIGSDGLNDIPCGLINDSFMRVFDAYLSFLRNLNFSLVLVGYDSGTAINGMTKIDFIFKNQTNSSLIPAIWLIDICGRSVVACRLVAIARWFQNFIAP